MRVPDEFLHADPPILVSPCCGTLVDENHPLATEWNEWLAEYRAEEAKEKAEFAKWCFPLLSVEHLADLKPPEWIVDTIVPEGDVVVFGHPGTYKSFLALDMALSVASGQDWHGNQVKHGDVVYVAAEGVRGMKARIDAWQEAYGPADLSRIFFVPQAVNLLEPDQVARIGGSLELLEEDHGASELVLLVIDTMARSMVGGDENSARDVGLFLNELSQLPALTRMIVHHAGKNGDHERGSTALRGAADMMARVEREELAPRVELICHKPPKDGEMWPSMTFERKLAGESMVLDKVPVFNALVDAAEERRDAVLEFIRKNGPVSQNSIVRGIGGKGVLVRSSIKDLVGEGAVTFTQRGQTKLYQLPLPSLGDAVGKRS